jgi:hypothetical protein
MDDANGMTPGMWALAGGLGLLAFKTLGTKPAAPSAGAGVPAGAPPGAPPGYTYTPDPNQGPPAPGGSGLPSYIDPSQYGPPQVGPAYVPPQGQGATPADGTMGPLPGGPSTTVPIQINPGTTGAGLPGGQLGQTVGPTIGPAIGPKLGPTPAPPPLVLGAWATDFTSPVAKAVANQGQAVAQAEAASGNKTSATVTKQMTGLMGGLLNSWGPTNSSSGVQTGTSYAGVAPTAGGSSATNATATAVRVANQAAQSNPPPTPGANAWAGFGITHH